MRYTATMTSVLVQSMAKNFEDALRMLEAAVSDCPGELWEMDIWPDEAPTRPGPHGGLQGSAPWFLAYHALSVLDYDLTGDVERWEPPPPFHEHVWGWPSRVFSQADLLGYIDWCRGRIRRTLDALTDDAAARPLPESHRYRGMPFGVLVGTLPMHAIEHAAQIRQFITAAGAEPQPRP